MPTDEYFTRVQHRADLNGNDETSRMTSTVLGIFGTLDLRGELKNAASQLPQGIAPMLVAREASESFSASEFVASSATVLSVDEAAAGTAAAKFIDTLGPESLPVPCGMSIPTACEHSP